MKNICFYNGICGYGKNIYNKYNINNSSGEFPFLAGSRAMNVSSSQTVNSTTQRALRGNDPVRLHVTTALAQVIVWPFILVDLFMLLVYLRRPVLRAEARYVLFAQTLYADSIFLTFFESITSVTQMTREIHIPCPHHY